MTISPALALVSLSVVSFAAAHPTDEWEFVIESGYLQNIRNKTPLEYEIRPGALRVMVPLSAAPDEQKTAGPAE